MDTVEMPRQTSPSVWSARSAVPQTHHHHHHQMVEVAQSLRWTRLRCLGKHHRPCGPHAPLYHKHCVINLFVWLKTNCCKANDFTFLLTPRSLQWGNVSPSRTPVRPSTYFSPSMDRCPLKPISCDVTSLHSVKLGIHHVAPHWDSTDCYVT